MTSKRIVKELKKDSFEFCGSHFIATKKLAEEQSKSKMLERLVCVCIVGIITFSCLALGGIRTGTQYLHMAGILVCVIGILILSRLHVANKSRIKYYNTAQKIYELESLHRIVAARIICHKDNMADVEFSIKNSEDIKLKAFLMESKSHSKIDLINKTI